MGDEVTEEAVAPYTDLSQLKEEEIAETIALESSIKFRRWKHMDLRSEHTFPARLHCMLTELEKDGLDEIASWQPHGRCFNVHKPAEFVKTVLPLWFQQSKIQSFNRQLNLYGFRRITSGIDRGSYYHELFLRNKAFLSKYIPRSSVKGRGRRMPSSRNMDPNLYAFPYLSSPNKPLSDPVDSDVPMEIGNNEDDKDADGSNPTILLVPNTNCSPSFAQECTQALPAAEETRLGLCASSTIADPDLVHGESLQIDAPRLERDAIRMQRAAAALAFAGGHLPPRGAFVGCSDLMGRFNMSSMLRESSGWTNHTPPSGYTTTNANVAQSWMASAHCWYHAQGLLVSNQRQESNDAEDPKNYAVLNHFRLP